LQDSHPPREIGGSELVYFLRQDEQSAPDPATMEPSSSLIGTWWKQPIWL